MIEDQYTLLQTYVMIKPVIAKRSASGIILPDTATTETLVYGRVVASSDECEHVDTGDIVLFNCHAGYQTKIDGDAVFIMHENTIIAVVEGRYEPADTGVDETGTWIATTT
jgi:co-chaperonin GroES (HSP10)